MDTIYTSNELEDLFNTTVYPHIINTTGKIASYYKHKHHEDYEDIQQLIAMDVWRVMERLLEISTDSNSFMRILTSAINFSFKTHYGKLKRTIYVPSQSHVNLEEFEIETPSDVNKLNILIDMDNLSKHIVGLSAGFNRFTANDREAIDFCLKSILLGREPSKKIISAFYMVENAAFCIDYAKYLIRLSLFQIHKHTGH
jgi:hypothetical protein